MEMRGGFMRPPRPVYPLRGRGVMGMERLRLAPPLRPGLIRGGPPVPFVGRGMVMPPHGRPRGIASVILPRPLPPPGAMVPISPRSMMPRPILRPRPPMAPDASKNSAAVNGDVPPGNNQFRASKEANEQVQTPNQQNNNSNKNNKTNNRGKGSGVNMQQQAGVKKNRKDNKVRRTIMPSAQQISTQQIPIQTQPTGPPMGQPPLHAPHLTPQLPPPNHVNMNASQMPKHLHPAQSQINVGLQHQHQQQPQHHPMQQSMRTGRNNGSQRNLGQMPVGRGIVNNVAPATSMMPNSRHNVVMNRGVSNIPPRVGINPPPVRSNAVVGGPGHGQFSIAPPTSYAVPPPVVSGTIPMKRGPPPVVPPPVMPPKRVRYDPPSTANGYTQYQQQPPPQQTIYASYEMPPPVDVYNNTPPNVNVAPPQNYNSPDYNYQVTTQANNPYVTAASSQYSSSYNSGSSYSNYSSASGYDTSVDYSSVTAQPVSATNTDPYGYPKQVSSVDSYSYSNVNYTNPQTGYEDYSSSYVDNSAYSSATNVQDPAYNHQTVGTYSSYSY